MEPAWLNGLASDVFLSLQIGLSHVGSTSYQGQAGRVEPAEATMRRSVSLTRLSSQPSVSMAGLLPDTACDDSVTADPRSPSMLPLFHGEQPLVPASGSSSHPTSQQAHPWRLPGTSGNLLKGLTFTPSGGRYHMDPHEAWTAMSEGSMQCAVTGTAFEHLLQLPDTSLLEAVLRNAVVFSRMQVCPSAVCFHVLPTSWPLPAVLRKCLCACLCSAILCSCRSF